MCEREKGGREGEREGREVFRTHNNSVSRVLQCVLVCCSVLQCVAVRCSVLTSDQTMIACHVCCSVLQRVAACCSVLASNQTMSHFAERNMRKMFV